LTPLETAVIGASSLERVPQRYEVRGGGGARFWPFGRTVGTKIISGLTPEQPLDNPTGTVLGGIDLAFVTIYVYPLLIVALLYDVSSRDRELGTLALVASQPITVRQWLTMRVAVRGFVIAGCGVLLPAMVMAAAMPERSSEALVRLFVWTVAVLFYTAVWAALAVVVSLRARASALAAIMAVAVWLLAVIVIPAVLQLASPFLSPPAVHLSYVTEERAASLAINARVDSAIAALNQLVRTRFGGASSSEADHPTFTEPVEPPVEGNLLIFPQSPWAPPTSVVRLNRGFAEARRAYVEGRLAPVLVQLDTNERRESAFFVLAQYLSPALTLRGIADDLAGTGRYRWRSFLGQLDDYVRRRDAFFRQKVLSNANLRAIDIGDALVGFGYREEPMIGTMRRVALSMLSLVLVVASLGLGVMRSSRRWGS
jgi:ABC-2 type transport system permease protein